MLPENKRMRAFLAANGIEATPKYIRDGTLRGTWRLYNHDLAWTPELTAKLTALGFTDFDHKPLGPHSGNGGRFSVFVHGHDEFLREEPEREASEDSNGITGSVSLGGAVLTLCDGSSTLVLNRAEGFALKDMLPGLLAQMPGLIS